MHPCLPNCKFPPHCSPEPPTHYAPSPCPRKPTDRTLYRSADSTRVPCKLSPLPPPPQEYYEFIDSESGDIFNKLGAYAWLATAIAFAETLVIIKFARGCAAVCLLPACYVLAVCCLVFACCTARPPWGVALGH
jgi:hypothetical protein